MTGSDKPKPAVFVFPYSTAFLPSSSVHLDKTIFVQKGRLMFHSRLKLCCWNSSLNLYAARTSICIVSMCCKVTVLHAIGRCLAHSGAELVPPSDDTELPAAHLRAPRRSIMLFFYYAAAESLSKTFPCLCRARSSSLCCFCHPMLSCCTHSRHKKKSMMELTLCKSNTLLQ